MWSFPVAVRTARDRNAVEFAQADQKARASLDEWWQSFGDPQLDLLVREALARNSGSAVAGLRLRGATLNAKLAGINPTVGASYGLQESRLLKAGESASRLHSLSFSAAYGGPVGPPGVCA